MGICVADKHPWGQDLSWPHGVATAILTPMNVLLLIAGASFHPVGLLRSCRKGEPPPIRHAAGGAARGRPIQSSEAKIASEEERGTKF